MGSVFTSLRLTGLGIILALLFVSCSPSGSGGETQYHCPMHPTVVQDRKGSCPICGMDLVPIAGQKAAGAIPEQPAEYHCPMHPTIVADKKGSCPICGMDLVPVQSESAQASAVPGLATISITPEIRQRMGLTMGTIAKRELAREIRTSALIVADESRLHHVSVKVEGWVDKLLVSTTGQEVKQGDPVLTIYSPELVSAQEEYLIALKAKDTPGGEQLVAAARRRLELWDVSDEQIAALEKSGTPRKHLTVAAHVSGVMLEKSVFAGHKVMPNETLMTIADLSEVWADADLYQSDLPYVKVGMPVEITLPYWPGKIFKGAVTFVTPTLEAASRTIKARLEIDNAERLLKPGMYADAKLAYSLGETLAIPASAVMRTGERSYAFKDGGDGKLIPVAIRIGTRSGDDFELLDGLQAGDRVVTSANFLVDSESSLKAALAAMSGAKAGGDTEADPHAGHQR